VNYSNSQKKIETTSHYIKMTSVDQYDEEYDEARLSGTTKIVDFYNSYAEQYERILDEQVFFWIGEYSAGVLWKALSDKKSEEEKAQLSVIDVACGTGKTGEFLQEAGFKVIDGVDPAEKMLAIAREKKLFREIHVGRLGPLETDGFKTIKENSYDGLLCVGCLTKGAAAVKDALPEFVRILKKGGLGVYVISQSLNKIDALKDHIPYFENQQLDIVTIEKKFYRIYNDVTTYCHVYIVRKM